MEEHILKQQPEDMFEDPAYRQHVLWKAYQIQQKILNDAQNEAAAFRTRLENTCPYSRMARVKYEGEVYYVYSCKLSVGMGNQEDPSYWLTLTKLTKAGLFPSKPLKSAYCSSDKVDVIGRFGDDLNAAYFEAQETR